LAWLFPSGARCRSRSCFWQVAKPGAVDHQTRQRGADPNRPATGASLSTISSDLSPSFQNLQADTHQLTTPQHCGVVCRLSLAKRTEPPLPPLQSFSCCPKWLVRNDVKLQPPPTTFTNGGIACRLKSTLWSQGLRGRPEGPGDGGADGSRSGHGPRHGERMTSDHTADHALLAALTQELQPAQEQLRGVMGRPDEPGMMMEMRLGGVAGCRESDMANKMLFFFRASTCTMHIHVENVTVCRDPQASRLVTVGRRSGGDFGLASVSIPERSLTVTLWKEYRFYITQRSMTGEPLNQ
jgi:hypothetical protein